METRMFCLGSFIPVDMIDLRKASYCRADERERVRAAAQYCPKLPSMYN